MHSIHPHDSHISSVIYFPSLDEMAFCLCGNSIKEQLRKKLFPYLIAKGIPFVDVGMSLGKRQREIQLTGHLRVTSASSISMVTSRTELPMDDPADNIYNSNIQIAEINALMLPLR